MLVWVSLQAYLHSSPQYCVGVLNLDVEKWHRASESSGQVSLPVTCQAASVTQLCRGVRQVSLPVTCQAASVTQPDRLTWSCDHASHVLRHHAGVTTVERPDPKGTLYSTIKAGSLKMNTALEYSTRVVHEGGRRCKKSTLNDLVYLTPLRIPLMNPPLDCKVLLYFVKYCTSLLRS
jgi:hypothetical protein